MLFLKIGKIKNKDLIYLIHVSVVYYPCRSPDKFSVFCLSLNKMFACNCADRYTFNSLNLILNSLKQNTKFH